MEKFKGKLQPTYLTVVLKVPDERSEFSLSSQRGVTVVESPFDLQTDHLLEDLSGVHVENGRSAKKL